MNRILALWRTSIGKKVAMAVSGFLLLLFLISHMISNVTVLVDPRHLDDYAAWLRSLGPLLWVARIGLLVLAVIHIVAAVQLTRLARAARPVSYSRRENQVASYAARTMRWGGLLLVVFIIYHLLHLTFGTVHPDFHHGQVGDNLIVGLSSPAVAAFYLVSMLALGMHFWHGTWSVFQTFGANHPAWNRSRNVIAIVITVIVAGGFLLIPISALLGVFAWPR